MRNPTRLGLAALVSVTGFFVACGDDSSNTNTLPGGGNSTAGAGGAGTVGPDPSLLYTFDANTMPLLANGNGFSPGPGGSGGPGIANNTLLAFEPTMGHPGGAAKISVPFTVATQQADFGASF